MSHSWIHSLHIISSLLLAGGLLAGSVVRAGVKRSDDLAAKAFGMKLMARLFHFLTLPGLVVAGLLGFHLVASVGFPFAATWVQLSSMIYVIMLLIATIVVLPVVRRGAKEAEKSVVDGAPTEAFTKITSAKLWGILHDVISLAVVVLVFLMVHKP